ncbi:MAG: protein kinase [Candidatus Aminicenantes bacterium]|nr:protein kinase [Candidatus Aminicenantes bacterium]
MTVTCLKCSTENTRDSRFCKTCASALPGTPDTGVTLTQTLTRPIQELSPGALFAGRYQIIEDLGQGGMGHVFKALDTRTGEKIAVKVLRSGLEADGRSLDRFSHELTAARRISHRNVCRMFDLGEDGGRLYITMEFVPGEDLKSILRMMGAMSPAQAVGLTVQICDGLEEAHRLGVVHRDLKPANILVDKEGHARIMDFGIARSARSRGITDTGSMVGTPDYMSPEQTEGQDVDGRSDLYSMGVMLFEMATGQLPFEGDTALAVALKHKTERPPDPKSFAPGLPGDLSKIILRCLEKDKDRRYPSAADLRADLEAVAAALPSGSRVIPRRKPATSREITVKFPVKRLVWPGVALVVLIATAIFLLPVLKKTGAGKAAAKIPGSVVVVAFENQTGDPKYDPMRKVIPSLLITNLENTGLFQVSTWERMRDVLSQMGQKGVDMVDGDSGFAFCRREGVAFIVVGSFSKLGDTFVTEFKLLDTDSRKIVKTAAARGTGEDSILNTHIDELSRLIAQGMGVAGQKLDSTRMAVAEVTTHSTEAYAAYLQGREQLDRFEEPEARKSFERAVALDPEFAIAYVRLAQTLEREGNWERVQAAYRKAKELAARAPEKERMLIEAKYAWRIERDERKTADLLRSLVSKYPSEKDFHVELGIVLGKTDPDGEIAEYKAALALDPEYGIALNQMAFALLRRSDFAGAQTALERYVAVAPDQFNPLDSLGLLLFLRGRYDEAIDKYKKAKALDNWYGSEGPIAYMLALKEDYDGALDWLERYMTSVTSDAFRAEGPAWQGIINYLIGRRALAFERLEAGLALARSSKSTFREGLILVIRGFIRCDMGERELARDDFDLARRILEPVSASAQVAWRTGQLYWDIRWGDTATTDKVMAELDRIAPPENLRPWSAAMRRSFLILMYLGRGDDEAALREAALPRMFEVVNPNLNFNLLSLGGHNMPLALFGIAELLSRRGETDKAIEEYRLLMTTGPGTGLRRLINPIYHFRVAGLYEKKGDKAKAIEHYRKFLEIWTNADPDLLEPGLARARLAALEK